MFFDSGSISFAYWDKLAISALDQLLKNNLLTLDRETCAVLKITTMSYL